MRAETNSTVSAGSMPLRQAQPASRSRQLCRPMSSARRRKVPVLGSNMPARWKQPVDSQSRGQEPSNVRKASMCLTMASGVMTMEGVSSCPFFSMRLSSTAKACFASMPGGTDTARTLPDMRNGEGPASGPRCRRSSRTCPIHSGSRSSGHAHRRQLLPDHETYTGSSGLTASSMCCHPPSFQRVTE